VVDDELELGMALAMRAKFGIPPPKNITGMPAFSAAGQNQSAVPSVSHFAVSGVNARRMPNMLRCCFQAGMSAGVFGSSRWMRPMTPKRLGYFATASAA